jgi:hypothetical protein
MASIIMHGDASSGYAVASGILTNADFEEADRDSAIGRPVNNIASLAFAARDALITVSK